ncbi:unnamed protein product [Phytomonas sp. EM1]|nr:unnamed protein product [Phytomonas sp. EM1]|eukprot:CCW60482.1 unnamed protein product [Phytomonas sp. isolate EM1]
MIGSHSPTLGSPPHAGNSTSSDLQRQQSANELGTGDLLQYVVDHVNELLNRNYSLVDFDSLSPVKLLQVVDDVFATLQPSLKMDLESLSSAQYIPILTDFLLKPLGYRVPPLIQSTFHASFANAEPTVIYPMLYWVLTHMEINKKRVYLARFLQPLEIPDDIRAQDEDVRGLYAQYQQLRGAFIQTHRRVDALHSAFTDPQETRRKVAALEEENVHLKEYLQAAMKKLENVRDKDLFLSESKSLRAAQEESSKLAEKFVELQQSMLYAEARRTEISNSLQCLRRDAAEGRVDTMIRRMKDEIQTNKIKLEEQLPLELDAKQKENEELRKLLSEPLDMTILTNENQKLEDALRNLKNKIKERLLPSEDGSSISTIKQQVQRVIAHKKEVLDELSSWQTNRNKVLDSIREREAHITQLRSASNMISEDEFREFFTQIRVKKAVTEGVKQRLTELHAEWGTLVFTKELLQGRYKELEETIRDLESKMGLQGYGRTVEVLSKLTQEKNVIEGMKGKTLEELSRVVQDFNLAIREGRNRLAPLINELRVVRQTAAEVDEQWNAKKMTYDHLEGLLTENMRNLDEQVTRVKEEVAVNESMYHRIHCQNTLQDARRKLVHDEGEFRAGTGASLDRHFKSYTEYFTQTARNLEDRIKWLQVKHRDINESYTSGVQQVEYFTNLKNLLSAKQASLNSEENANGGSRNNLDIDIQNVMGSQRNMGFDRLVLNSN